MLYDGDINTLPRYKLLLLLAEVRMLDYDICEAIDKIDEQELKEKDKHD